nr:SGNH hydrolase-type esterase domain-containing protein [Tanacetum cinerariifolium]
MVVSDSDQEEGGKQDMDLDALLALANVAMTVDSNIPPGGASNNHAASTSVLADVPTSVALAGVSNKGKTPIVKEDITVKERTFKQMKDDRLGEQAAKRLHDEEQAQVDRQRAELQRRRQQEVLASAMTLKRTGPVLEEPSSKRKKSTEAPIIYVPEVPQSPVISSPKSSGTRRK